MEIGPILSTLRRHKTAAGLIVVEIAIATAIVCNALHLIANRLALLNRDSGVAESELVELEVRNAGGPLDADDATAQDLRAMRSLPGVRSVTVANQVIYGDNSNNSDLALRPGKGVPRVQVSDYEAGQGALQTLGLRLTAGRDFLPEEYRTSKEVNASDHPDVPAVVINRELAQRLWPGTSPLGQVVYVFDDTPSHVVGVVERLTHPYPGHAKQDSGLSVLFPVRPTYRGGSYLLRVDPQARDAVMRALPGLVDAVDPTRVVDKLRTVTEMRSEYFAQDRSMVWLMGGVCVALLVVTAFGIVGLASFWVQQRARMIGTRRALGATRAQIRHYFQLENFLLTSVGVAIGMFMAYGGSVLLMHQYPLPRLPWGWLPAGAAMLWALGQVAVLAPARRAAALPPVAAMRGA